MVQVGGSDMYLKFYTEKLWKEEQHEAGTKAGPHTLTLKKELEANFERSTWIVNKKPAYPHSI